MALLWIEGWEQTRILSQATRKYASASSWFTSTNAGRTHGFCGNPASGAVVSPAFTLDNTCVVGFAANLSTHTTALNSGNKGLYIESAETEQLHIEFESTSGQGFRPLIKRGSTTVATGAYVAFNVWHYFEFKFTVRGSTNGAYEVRVNGITDISGTGVNLANSGTDGWDNFAWRYNGSVGNLALDDFYALNGTGSIRNDFLGPQVVEGVTVTANGAVNQFTQSSGGGSNWERVDDAGNVAPADTNAITGYNFSDTNGHQELYGLSNLSVITGDVNGLQVIAQCAMAAAGSRTMKHILRDAAGPSIEDGDNFVVSSTTYAGFSQIYEQNPASASDFTPSEINDLQLGIEVVS